jgi:hypothetical protein
MAARDTFDELFRDGWPTVIQWVSSARSESVHLEFKSRDRRPGVTPQPAELEPEDRGALAKALSAMSVEGGVILLGLRTNKTNAVDPAHLSPNQEYLADAEAFKRAVQRHYRDLVDPVPNGIRIETIIDPTAPPRGVLAILIPASDGGPHRTTRAVREELSNKYYMRTDADTVVMPHAMLAALFGRRPAPALRLVVAQPKPHIVQFMLKNAGRGLARLIQVRLALIKTDGTIASADLDTLGGPGWELCHGHSDTPTYSIVARTEAIAYQDDLIEVCTFKSKESPRDGFDHFVGTFRARLDAENMQPLTFDGKVPPHYNGDGKGMMYPLEERSG